jgi:hypothetical protein
MGHNLARRGHNIEKLVRAAHLDVGFQRVRVEALLSE